VRKYKSAGFDIISGTGTGFENPISSINQKQKK